MNYMTKKKDPKKATTKTPNRLSRFSRLKNSSIFRFFVLWLVAYSVLMSFFFRAILKNYSYLEIFPRELVFPSVMHAFTALFVVLVVYWLPWLKTFSGKLTSCLVLALLMIDYDSNMQATSGIIRAFTPGLTDADSQAIVSVIYLSLMVAFAVFIGIASERLTKKSKRVGSKDVALGLIAMTAYLLFIPAFSLARILPTMIRETNTQAPELAKDGQANGAKEKPDIYYIVLDRYANADVLKKQFNYDNSNFTDFLKSNDFTVNNNAYANYSYTTISISSTLNAQYTNDVVSPYKNSEIQTRTLYHNLIQQASVIKALKKEGYEYHSVGSWYGASNKTPLADVEHMYQQKLKVFGLEKKLRGIEINEFTKSPYMHFAQAPGVTWWPFKYQTLDHTEMVRKQLNTLDELANSDKQGGRFIFAHILVPHDPFAFNADGSIATNWTTDNNGKLLKEKYTAQVQFINSQMEELVGNIQKRSSGKAIVVFNADEGPYPQNMNSTFKRPQTINQASTEAITKNEDMTKWTDDYFKMKFGILQAVHIPGATTGDLQQLSSVNVFRIILNRYFGYDLGYLPNCHFGLTDGSKSEYVYADITKEFTEQPDKNCQNLQSQ